MNIGALFSGIKKFVFDRGLRVGFLAQRGFYHWMSDEAFLKLQYKAVFNRKLDLENPKTFNEKLQWLKLFNRRPEYTMMVDKYEVKKYIADKIGEEYVIPTLGVWDDPDEIDFNALPEQFVLKCNHNSAVGLCVCRDKSKLDIESVRSELRKGLKQNCYMVAREWPYKNVKPKIICEQYIADSPDSDALTDYKFYCFDGFVDCTMVCVDRNIGKTKFYYFNKDWKLQKNYNSPDKMPPYDTYIPKPPLMDKMFDIASQLSKGLPHVRVDLYSCNGRIYFGELTFFSSSGFDTDISDYLDLHWGKLLKLPEKL